MERVVSAVAETQGTLASLAVSAEPDGRYEVVYGNIVEKPLMGAFEAWTALGTLWLAPTIGQCTRPRVHS